MLLSPLLSETDAALENRIVDIINAGNALSDKKQFAEAIRQYDQACALLPEPKFAWEMIGGWLTGSYYNAWFALGNYEKAKAWAEVELEYRRSEIDVGPHMDLGMALYELGQLDEAFRYFDAIYRYGKRRPFKEYPHKYLEFYLARQR
ncbi:hypothetical protein GA0061071_106174 [Kosakonia oryzendophytica]|uniref:Tetratricopeptide repeat-containing protein n=1 Tax=Kosakonia oryzendophytica TaxID=1005665 RepID=A0A1C4C1G3_9ENTR|nr:tetratricopeptide repeat protein [Kosakonia oryzendophytica]AMO46708.1 Hypothetical protein AKI40_0280 [Enterobacter sp. FY-07]WBT58481.1 hypothetical protein O9K67_01385 [Kosakonia oryzendophytica]SCC12951.1 hypothetical protein GA0061071_106174 [Kosakonia oryzendophytica]